MRVRNLLVLSVQLLLLVLPSCGEKTDEKAATVGGKPTVVVTFFPVYYMVEEIAGDAVNLVCPLPKGSDPIFWQPGDADIEILQHADLVIANGAGYEKWMTSLSLPESRLVNTAAPLKDEYIYIKKGREHRHGAGGLHSHVGMDGHTWLDLENARIQARQVLEGLVLLMPNKEDDFRRRHLLLDGKLAELAAQFKELGQEFSGVPILSSHPAYNYLARRIGLDIFNLDLDPMAELSPEALQAIKETLLAHKASILLWESQPLARVAETVKSQFGLTSVVFSPCEDPGLAKPGAHGDFVAMMAANYQNLRRALAKR